MSRSSSGAKRALLQLVCALMLLAQHVGLAHAVWHAHQQLPAQQESLDSDRSDRSHTLKFSKLCAFDAVFGQVLGCAPPATHSFSSRIGDEEDAVHAEAGRIAGASLTPRSRGPPPLL